MLQFVQNPVNVIILGLVIALVYMCVHSLWKDRKTGCSACGKNCSSCSIACGIQSIREQQAAKHRETV